MISVRALMAEGGLPAVFDAVGCRRVLESPSLSGCVTFEEAWLSLGRPGVMIDIADAAGVDSGTLAEACLVNVIRVCDFACYRPQMAADMFDAVRAALRSPDDFSLQAVLGATVGTMIRVTRPKRGGDSTWMASIDMAVHILGKAVSSAMCTCPVSHRKQTLREIRECLSMVVLARMECAVDRKQLPAGSVPLDWSSGWAANAVREVIPVEMVLAHRLAAHKGARAQA